jgi:small Trp-rich protein
MYLIILGLVLVVLKWYAWGPVADLSWWIVVAPFALAMVWWFFADLTGYTSRKALAREQREVASRRNRRAKRFDPR